MDLRLGVEGRREEKRRIDLLHSTRQTSYVNEDGNFLFLSLFPGLFGNLY